MTIHQQKTTCRLNISHRKETHSIVVWTQNKKKPSVGLHTELKVSSCGFSGLRSHIIWDVMSYCTWLSRYKMAPSSVFCPVCLGQYDLTWLLVRNLYRIIWKRIWRWQQLFTSLTAEYHLFCANRHQSITSSPNQDTRLWRSLTCSEPSLTHTAIFHQQEKQHASSLWDANDKKKSASLILANKFKNIRQTWASLWVQRKIIPDNSPK